MAGSCAWARNLMWWQDSSRSPGSLERIVILLSPSYFTCNFPCRLPIQNDPTLSVSSGSLWYLRCIMASAEVASFHHHHQSLNSGLRPHWWPTVSVSTVRGKSNGPTAFRSGKKWSGILILLLYPIGSGAKRGSVEV